MTDLSTTIIPKSDQLNADDLIVGPRAIKITDVRGVSGDQPIAISFEGDNGKPFKPCKSMRRLLVFAWGSDGKEYIGRSLMLFNDPAVMWAGKPVGGIRISHMSHIEKPFTIALTVTRGNKKPYKVDVLKAQDQQPAQSELKAADVLAAAKAEARKGKDAFTAYWNGPAKIGNTRELLQPHMTELSELSTNADAGNGMKDEVPFD